MNDRGPVSDVMSRSVAKVRPDARLVDAARLMREFHVSGLPVVSDDGSVVGILSEKDLVRGLNEATGVGSPRGLLDLLLGSAPAKGPSLLELARRQLDNGYVRELMTAPAICIGPTTSLRDAAGQMRAHSINRLPVVDEHRALVGIVTRKDIVGALAEGPTPRSRGSLRPGPARTSKGGGSPDPYLDI